MWAEYSTPWCSEQVPSFIVPIGDVAIAVVPDSDSVLGFDSETSFTFQFDGTEEEGRSLTVVRTETTVGLTRQIISGPRTVRLRQVEGLFIIDEWNRDELYWNELLPVPAYAGTSAVLVQGNRLLLIGGFDTDNVNHMHAVNDVVVMDLDNGIIEKLPALPQARGGAHAYQISRGRVLVVGGHMNAMPTHEESQSPVTEIFDFADLTWELGDLPHQGTVGFSTTQLSNGNILIAGGGVEKREFALSNCDLFDITTGKWRVVSPLLKGRTYGTLISLNDGRAVLVGGTHVGIEWVGNVDGNASLYDSKSDTWSELPNLIHGRFGLTGSLIGNDGIIVAGSVDGESRQVQSLELLQIGSLTAPTVFCRV